MKSLWNRSKALHTPTKDTTDLIDLTVYDECCKDHRKWKVFVPDMKFKKNMNWQYFGLYDFKKHPEMSCFACCNLCRDKEFKKEIFEDIVCNWEVNLTKDKTPSKLDSHMDSHHPELVKAATNAAAVALIDAQEKIEESPHTMHAHFSSKAQTTYAELEMRWIIKTYQPLSAVEEPTFRAMQGSQQSKYEPTTAETLKARISRKEAEVREACVRMLRHEYMCITSDHWTSGL
jgi:hypothetical protein